MYTDGSLVFDDISQVKLDAYASIFEADVDTSGIGEVYHRVTTDSSVVHKANDIVNNAFQLESDFNADEALVATWDNVGYYDSKADKVRTIYLHDIVSLYHCNVCTLRLMCVVHVFCNCMLGMTIF